MLSCFSCDRKFLSHKTLREDRTAAVRKYVAEATSRRRRILRAGFFYFSKEVFHVWYFDFFVIRGTDEHSRGI